MHMGVLYYIQHIFLLLFGLRVLVKIKHFKNLHFIKTSSMSGRAANRPWLLEQDAASHELHVVVHFAVCGSSIRSGLPCPCSHRGQVKIIKCRFSPVNRTGEHAAAAAPLTD